MLHGPDTPATCPPPGEHCHPGRSSCSAQPPAHRPPEPIHNAGGYLRTALRSLRFRPLALPSAPVATLRPTSAARQTAVSPPCENSTLPGTARGDRTHRQRPGRGTASQPQRRPPATSETAPDLARENFLYCYQGAGPGLRCAESASRCPLRQPESTYHRM